MVEVGLVSFPVVEHFDVVEQDCSEFGSGEVFPAVVNVAEIAFERRLCRFHRGIIEAIADRSERSADVVVIEPVRELERRVLGAVVLMRNEIVGWLSAAEGHD